MGTLDMTYMHREQLFVGGRRERVVKSHCCLCHRRMEVINHPVKGNCCMLCNDRTSKVGRYLITPDESDVMLAMITQEPVVEAWEIDGIPYQKHPDGTLERVGMTLFHD